MAAKEIYERLMENHSGNAQLHYALGTVLFHSGQLDEAEQRFARSVEILPEQVESLHYLARIAAQKAEPEKAVDLFSKVLEKRPTHTRAHLELGLIYRKLRKLEPARRELEAAVRLDPNFQKAQYQLGLLLARLGEREKAKQHLEIASTLRKEDDKGVSWRLLLPEEAAGQAIPRDPPPEAAGSSEGHK